MTPMDPVTETQKKLTIAAVLVATGVGLFAAGRYTAAGANTKEVTKTVFVEVEKEVTKTVFVEVEKKVYVRGEDRDVVREIVVIKSPDGTETTKTTETDKTKVKEASTQETNSMATSVVERIVEKTVFVDKLKIVEAYKAQWHIGLRVGAGARVNVPAVSPILQVGVAVERRIAGPLWLGVWADTQLSLPTPAVPPQSITGGISVALEF